MSIIKQSLLQYGLPEEQAIEIEKDIIKRQNYYEKLKKSRWYIFRALPENLSAIYEIYPTALIIKDSPAEKDKNITKPKKYRIYLNGLQAITFNRMFPTYQITIKFPPRKKEN